MVVHVLVLDLVVLHVLVLADRPQRGLGEHVVELDELERHGLELDVLELEQLGIDVVELDVVELDLVELEQLELQQLELGGVGVMGR